MAASNIQVAIKVRPIDPNQVSKWEVEGNSIKLIDGGGPEPFYFDHIFDQEASNQVIFDTIAKQIVGAGVKGFNGTIFAYGQTSSGKTYTMMGDEQNPGVMVLAAKKIFREIENSTDWQFLLRVSYIEIYNEKIHDLLNKSNTDLKIHETSNGEVAVNCSENIITCEQDLLGYLREGSKARKIGETHMNERSSRSHAIFRIIIESKKIDQADEDCVQISILNLVDLAGSERADQTGATGSRLKEGGHINKSLLFLSQVIKKLAEGKYVSYRDSKLTRILQASLGGNALTAIICTINPTAVEESLSTLSFANRAKVVKNKPQKNEVVSDSAMLKRLVKKIDALTTELEVEKTKNSQIKVTHLQKLLNEEIHKIINSNSLCSLKASNRNRRRTWCPSSMIPTLAEETPAKLKSEAAADLPFAPQVVPPTKLQLPKSGFNFTPHITVRDVYYQEKLKEIEAASSPSIDEEFIPGEDVCFDDALTPQTSPTPTMKLGFRTPTTNSDFKLRASLTPKLTEQQSLQKVEQELKELETFTNLENKLNVEHDTYNTLKFKLENAERRIAGYEKEREHFAFLKVEHLETQTNLANCQKRCQELETKVINLEESSGKSLDRINRYEKEVTDLKAKIIQLEMENRAAVGLEFEFEQHKNKSKRRETELLEALEEKRKEISKLERSLQTVTNDMLNNSKEEIQQISRNLNEADTSCLNCKDFQRILTSKQQLIEDFEKTNSENQKLHTTIEKIFVEAESTKLRIDYLESENSSLKKQIANLTSLHGSLISIEEQIVNLREEKCKLEAIKIEFEVLSKETANKTAEKIYISQEIQTLTTQRDNLAIECEKLQADIASSNCTKTELDKIRTENDFLNTELQKIKTKLEITEKEQLKLMAENQSKSDSFEKLNMEVTEARNQLQTLQVEYLDIQQKYEKIQDECNKHEGTIGEIQSEYDSIQNKYQSLQKEYEKLENDSVQSIADCDRVQTQNTNLETEIRELKTKVEEAQRKLLENDSLQTELDTLRSEMNHLQEEYLNKQKQNDSQKHQLNETKDCDLKAENAKLKQQLNEIQTEYDETSTQLMDYIADIDNLQAEKDQLQIELDRIKSLTETSDQLETVKKENLKLEMANSELIKENSEWKRTVEEMTKCMKEKCDESENLVAKLQDIQMHNESLRNESTKSTLNESIHFIQLADSFAEIEVTLENGGTKLFQAVGSNKDKTGTRLTIGQINDITQGTFNEFRGSIEFAISAVLDLHKLSNEIFDSLEIDKQTPSTPNSCDSLEVPSDKQFNETHFNELIEEKAKLFENVRELQETVSMLKAGTIDLANKQQQLEDIQILVEELRREKSDLSAICEESKCKISDLSEIISRAESENLKLIADCEELKKAVESEGTLENVSRRQSLKDFGISSIECLKCVDLLEQISTLKAMFSNGSSELMDTHETLTEEEGQISGNNNEKIVIKMNGELDKSISVNGSPSEETSSLIEELKTEKSKYQDIQNQFNDLQITLDKQSQESVKSANQIEELNSKLQKLQTEYDELLICERMKSTELEESVESLENLSKECKLLKESATLAEDERNENLQEKKSLQETNSNLTEKLKTLEEDHVATLNKKNTAFEKYSELELEKDKLEKQCQNLKEQIQKLTKENKNNQNDEMERLIVELEKNANEKLIQEEKLNQLSEELIAVSAEKSHLQNEFEKLKEQQEYLKESHSDERRVLQEKITSQQKQIEELDNNKQELQLALEKARKHSEFLLEQGKSIEEKLNVDISVASAEIKDLKEKLQTTETNLQQALDKIGSEKDQLQVELTKCNESLRKKLAELESELAASKQSLETESKLKQSLQTECDELLKTKNSLAAKCSTLEEKLKDLENQIADTKQTIADSKHKLELSQKESSQKDELISNLSSECETFVTKSVSLEEKLATLERDLTLESSKKDNLSTENNSLTEKIVQLQDKILFLENQIEESKKQDAEESSTKDKLISDLTIKNSSLVSKCSDQEIKLNVLENAKTDREDLIVRLTNNNNFLSTKSSELEEKLAILENQFEESKRHLSTEVNRLNKTLAEANEASLAQSSKMDDLMHKIKSFEDEINLAQKTTLERDSLLQKLDEFKEKHDALALKNANLEMAKSSFEAELNSARAVVVENTTLTKQINELQASLKEMQLKCDSLRSTNVELQATNDKLNNDLQDAIQQAEKCNKMRGEISTLREEVEKERQLKNKLNNDWKSKELMFTKKISQLEADKLGIQKEFDESVKSSANKIVQLEQQLHSLQKDQSLNTSSSKSLVSPRKEKGMEHWMTENHQSKIKNMCLMDKLDSNQKSTPKEERRNRRLSTHDERRIQSFWDSNRDVSTMTDPTNAECSCSELNDKLNELKQRLLIRDSQVNTLTMELKNHPLKTEYANLKKLFAEEESKQQELRKEIKKYKSLMRSNESRSCAKCAESAKKIFVNSFCQTTTEGDESECYRKLLGKYEDLKMICRVRHTKIKELEDALSKGKENANNDNITSLSNQNYKQKYEQMKMEFKLLQEKYDEAKILCNKRYEQLKVLSQQQQSAKS